MNTMKIQMELGREAFGPLSRAIFTAAESTNGFVSAIGKFALPLAAAAGAVVLLTKAAASLQERGVDVTSLGDKWSAIR